MTKTGVKSETLSAKKILQEEKESMLLFFLLKQEKGAKFCVWAAVWNYYFCTQWVSCTIAQFLGYNIMKIMRC